jgi:quercetin dioxygenase-like cupin family protein
MSKRHLIGAGVLAALLSLSYAQAQTPGIQRTIVAKGDVADDTKEAVIARLELARGAIAGRHTHPGDEISYVLEGEGELLIDGAAPRLIKAGEAFVIPAGKVHSARNTGSQSMRLIGVFVVEKDHPLAKPAK